MLYVSDDLHPDGLFWLVAGAPKKGKFLKKIFSTETFCFMKLILCIHVPGISLYKKDVFLFQSDKNSGCYGNFQFP